MVCSGVEVGGLGHGWGRPRAGVLVPRDFPSEEAI